MADARQRRQRLAEAAPGNGNRSRSPRARILPAVPFRVNQNERNHGANARQEGHVGNRRDERLERRPRRDDQNEIRERVRRDQQMARVLEKLNEHRRNGHPLGRQGFEQNNRERENRQRSGANHDRRNNRTSRSRDGRRPRSQDGNRELPDNQAERRREVAQNGRQRLGNDRIRQIRNDQLRGDRRDERQDNERIGADENENRREELNLQIARYQRQNGNRQHQEAFQRDHEAENHRNREENRRDPREHAHHRHQQAGHRREQRQDPERNGNPRDRRRESEVRQDNRQNALHEENHRNPREPSRHHAEQRREQRQDPERDAYSRDHHGKREPRYEDRRNVLNEENLRNPQELARNHGQRQENCRNNDQEQERNPRDRRREVQDRQEHTEKHAEQMAAENIQDNPIEHINDDVANIISKDEAHQQDHVEETDGDDKAGKATHGATLLEQQYEKRAKENAFHQAEQVKSVVNIEEIELPVGPAPHEQLFDGCPPDTYTEREDMDLTDNDSAAVDELLENAETIPVAELEETIETPVLSNNILVATFAKKEETAGEIESFENVHADADLASVTENEAPPEEQLSYESPQAVLSKKEGGFSNNTGDLEQSSIPPTESESMATLSKNCDDNSNGALTDDAKQAESKTAEYSSEAVLDDDQSHHHSNSNENCNDNYEQMFANNMLNETTEESDSSSFTEEPAHADNVLDKNAAISTEPHPTETMEERIIGTQEEKAVHEKLTTGPLDNTVVSSSDQDVVCYSHLQQLSDSGLEEELLSVNPSSRKRPAEFPASKSSEAKKRKHHATTLENTNKNSSSASTEAPILDPGAVVPTDESQKIDEEHLFGDSNQADKPMSLVLGTPLFAQQMSSFKSLSDPGIESKMSDAVVNPEQEKLENSGESSVENSPFSLRPDSDLTLNTQQPKQTAQHDLNAQSLTATLQKIDEAEQDDGYLSVRVEPIAETPLQASEENKKCGDLAAPSTPEEKSTNSSADGAPTNEHVKAQSSNPIVQVCAEPAPLRIFEVNAELTPSAVNKKTDKPVPVPVKTAGVIPALVSSCYFGMWASASSNVFLNTGRSQTDTERSDFCFNFDVMPPSTDTGVGENIRPIMSSTLYTGTQRTAYTIPKNLIVRTNPQ